MSTGRDLGRRSGPVLLAALAWTAAVAVAGALGVAALRSADAAPDATVVSAAEAAALASSSTPSPSPTSAAPTSSASSPGPSSSTASPPTTAPTASPGTPPADGATSLGLGVGTLGARCDGGVPRYVWFVPAAGWAEHDREEDDGELELEVRSADEQRRFTIGCDAAGAPVLVASE